MCMQKLEDYTEKRRYSVALYIQVLEENLQSIGSSSIEHDTVPVPETIEHIYV